MVGIGNSKMSYSEKMTRYDNAVKAGVGDRCVREAKEYKRLRKESSDKATYNAAKEAADYLVGRANGRVSVTIDPKDWERIFGRKNDKKHN